MKLKYIVIIILAILTAGLVFWYMRMNKPKPQAYIPKIENSQTNQSLGAQVYEKQQNPVDGEIPQTNPFSVEISNPIEGSYANPF